MVRYDVTPFDPGAHLFEVVCHVASGVGDELKVSLPVWIPGSYLRRDFSRHVVTLEVSDGAGRPVAVEKIDNSRWRIAAAGREVDIRYVVYARDVSVRAAYLDRFRAYFNGVCLFLMVSGEERRPCEVTLVAPHWPEAREWRVATTLRAVETDERGFGRYEAAHYDDLIDHPVEMGVFDSVAFELEGKPHEMVFSGRHRGDLERVARDLKSVCAVHAELFGGLPADLSRYLFMTLVLERGYGGLEHRASTSLICSREDLPLSTENGTSDGYLSFLGLCSHEYFHLWNVKRIRPAAFQPYDLSKEALTRQLWVFEGITSYYDDLALVRAGIVDQKRYLELLGRTMTRVMRTSGRRKQSVADSSFDAWTKFYKQDENAPNAIVSYYAKGSLIALALDLLIRRLTDGARSLDDLMKRLWREYGEPEIGVPEGRVERMAGEIAGHDMASFFRCCLHGTEDPPLADLLADVGIEMVVRPAESTQDKGGTAASRPVSELVERADPGMRVQSQGEQLKIANVFDGGAAQKAGLAADDLLVALDGVRVTASNLETLLKSYRPGDHAEFHVFRRDELLALTVRFQAPPFDTCELHLCEDCDEGTKRRREAWLGRTR